MCPYCWPGSGAGPDAGRRPVVEPLPHRPHLGRRRLAACVEECEAEGGGQQRATAGEVRHGISYSITRSARPSNDGGTVRPRAFAALTLMNNSNLSACSMGKSPGPYANPKTNNPAAANNTIHPKLLPRVAMKLPIPDDR